MTEYVTKPVQKPEKGIEVKKAKNEQLAFTEILLKTHKLDETCENSYLISEKMTRKLED